MKIRIRDFLLCRRTIDPQRRLFPCQHARTKTHQNFFRVPERNTKTMRKNWINQQHVYKNTYNDPTRCKISCRPTNKAMQMHWSFVEITLYFFRFVVGHTTSALLLRERRTNNVVAAGLKNGTSRVGWCGGRHCGGAFQ